jgi:hypothetical protein
MGCGIHNIRVTTDQKRRLVSRGGQIQSMPDETGQKNLVINECLNGDFYLFYF